MPRMPCSLSFTTRVQGFKLALSGEGAMFLMDAWDWSQPGKNSSDIVVTGSASGEGARIVLLYCTSYPVKLVWKGTGNPKIVEEGYHCESFFSRRRSLLSVDAKYAKKPACRSEGKF